MKDLKKIPKQKQSQPGKPYNLLRNALKNYSFTKQC